LVRCSAALFCSARQRFCWCCRLHLGARASALPVGRRLPVVPREQRLDTRHLGPAAAFQQRRLGRQHGRPFSSAASRFRPLGGYPYGIPFNLVDSSHPRSTFSFQYSDESDHVPYPFGSDTSIEGGRAPRDRHAIMIDQSTCTLYELYNANYNGATSSTAGSGATWNLTGMPSDRRAGRRRTLPVCRSSLAAPPRGGQLGLGPACHPVHRAADRPQLPLARPAPGRRRQRSVPAADGGALSSPRRVSTPRTSARPPRSCSRR